MRCTVWSVFRPEVAGQVSVTTVCRRAHFLILWGGNDEYRIRYGNYRILYSIDDKKKEVIIYGILDRKGGVSMKAISVKFDDYVLDLINQEAKDKKVTRMEIIRAAVINYLLNRNDTDDLHYIQTHRNDELYSFEETFKE